MSLESIAAIGYATPVRSLGAADRRPNTPSEPPPQAPADGEQAGTPASGQPLTLSGLGAQGRELVAGDVLMVKVLSTRAGLEVALFDGAARGAAPVMEQEQAAMRPDQGAWMRQMVSRQPDALALAASWRTTMLNQLQQLGAPPDPADPATEAATLATAGRALVRAGEKARHSLAAGTTRSQGGANPWLLTAYAFGGLRVLLRLLVADAEPGSSPPAKRRATTLALRLALVLPDLGGVVVQLQVVPDGAAIDLVAERAEALQPLRERLPAVASGIARAGLRLLRCRVSGGLLGGSSGSALPTTAATPAAAQAAGQVLAQALQSFPTPGDALPLALFRAAAEVVLELTAA
jgi:hypothetical protein